MKLFLDSSVLLAACGSDRGASSAVIRLAGVTAWTMLTTPYVVEEVLANLSKLPNRMYVLNWARLRPRLQLMDDVLTLDRAAVVERAKDRPILFSALAWADVLLTLDRDDFGPLLGGSFYGLSILTPGMFLELERAAGRLTE